MTTSHVVAVVATFWLIGWWKVPFSIALGLICAYVWVVPWYLDDPECLIAIKRGTTWGNILSVFVNATLGYILWGATLFIFAAMAIQAYCLSRRFDVGFGKAFAAIFHDRKYELATAAIQGGEPS